MIDGQANQIVASVDVGVGSGTAGITVNPVANQIYATGGSRLTVIDGKTNAILNTIDLPSVAIGNGVAVNPATNLVYVAAIDQSVAVVDGATGRIVATTAALASSTPGIAIDDALGRANLPTPGGIAILAIGPNSLNPPVPHDGPYFPQTGIGSTTTPSGTTSTAEGDSPRSATR